MLEVHSPVPLQEGESIAFGINSKHVLHFVFGLVFASPIMITGLILLPLAHASRWASLIFGAVIGILFAVLKLQGRPLAEVILLSIRFSRRPKLVLFDRQYRVRVHRKKAADKLGGEVTE